MSSVTDEISKHAQELLSTKRVDYVIGYETGSDGTDARPLFVYDIDGVQRLVFDMTCTHNLTKYLAEPDRRGKNIGVVMKPCDSRALNVLLEEKQLSREKIVAIGVRCPGIVQRRREGGDGSTLQARCAACDTRTPVAYDVLVGEEVAVGSTVTASNAVSRFESRSADERVDFWAAEFERCLRCYACRQACPQCYCSECFAEMLDPEWVGIKIGQSENWMFHTIRAFHLAGRCVGCDECERACPVGIPLGLLNGKLRQEVMEKFEYRAGMSPETAPPLETFRKDDKLGVA